MTTERYRKYPVWSEDAWVDMNDTDCNGIGVDCSLADLVYAQEQQVVVDAKVKARKRREIDRGIRRSVKESRKRQKETEEETKAAIHGPLRWTIVQMQHTLDALDMRRNKGGIYVFFIRDQSNFIVKKRGGDPFVTRKGHEIPAVRVEVTKGIPYHAEASEILQKLSLI